MPKCRDECSPTSQEMIDASRSLLGAMLDFLPRNQDTKRLLSYIKNRWPDQFRLCETSGGQVGADPDDVLLANLSYDLLVSMPFPGGNMGCSTLALATGLGPMIARNMDWFPPMHVAKASCLVDTPHGTSAGFAGCVGVVTGRSDFGFSIALNAVLDPTTYKDGMPVLFFTRETLDDARSYQDALHRILTRPLYSSCIITIVGIKNNERAVVERRPVLAMQHPVVDDRPLIATNHFRLIENDSGCSRLSCLQSKTYKPANETYTDEELLAYLTDLKVLQDITAQHVITCPGTKKISLYVPDHLLETDEEPAMGLQEFLQL